MRLPDALVRLLSNRRTNGPARDERGIEVAEGARAAERHGARQLRPEPAQHGGHRFRSAHGQGVAGGPPHQDRTGAERERLQHRGAAADPAVDPHLCPAGIRIFANALSDVASLNGMERESWWAWRHGSIARRIA